MSASTDPSAGLIHLETARVRLSVAALRNLCIAIAVLICATASADHFLYSTQLPWSATLGRVSVAGLLVFCALLAHYGRTVPAFVLFASTVILGIYNAAVQAGFGAYSPALLFVLPVAVLACGIFGFSRGLIWSMPVVSVWMFFAIREVFAVIGQAQGLSPDGGAGQAVGVSGLPSPIAWLATQLMCALIVLAMIRLYDNSASELLKKETDGHQTAVDALQAHVNVGAAKERFMGQLSHEIRTPIAALANAVALLKHPKASDAVKQRSLKLIESTSNNLLSLLNDALDSFKYGDQQFVIRQESFDVAALLDEVRALFAASAEAKGVALSVEVGAVGSAMVVGDTMRLRQMLSNLVGNAIKFTDQGSVLLKVSRMQAVSDRTWRFEVTDTGRGISDENQKELFKPFSQVGMAEKKDAHGTGLGLSIVTQLAQAMGGQAGVVSQLGAGSTFWFEVSLDVPKEVLVSA